MKMIPKKTSILQLCVMQCFICIIKQNSFQKFPVILPYVCMCLCVHKKI